MTDGEARGISQGGWIMPIVAAMVVSGYFGSMAAWLRDRTAVPNTSMTLIRTLRWSGFLAAVTLSCHSSNDLPTSDRPVPGFPIAQASRDCAPWDGAAVTVFFSPKPILLDSLTPPYLTVSLWKDLEAIAGHVWRWPPEESIGAASLCSTVDDCQAARAAEVTIDQLGADSTVSGRIRLEFDNRPALGGNFRAPWRLRRFLCG